MTHLQGEPGEENEARADSCAEKPDDFRLLLEKKITSEEYVRRLRERVRKGLR